MIEAYKEFSKYNYNYDIIIMCDAAMPGNNIAFAARELRELGYRGFLVCITDNFGPENIQNYIDHGANKVLDYPFSVR